MLHHHHHHHQDPHAMHHHHHHAAAAHHHQYKVPRIYFKIPRVLPYKEQKEKFETDDYFKKLAREGEVRVQTILALMTLTPTFNCSHKGQIHRIPRQTSAREASKVPARPPRRKHRASKHTKCICRQDRSYTQTPSFSRCSLPASSSV